MNLVIGAEGISVFFKFMIFFVRVEGEKEGKKKKVGFFILKEKYILFDVMFFKRGKRIFFFLVSFFYKNIYVNIICIY